MVHVGDMMIAVDGIMCEGQTGEQVTSALSGEPGTWVELSIIPYVKVVDTPLDLHPFKVPPRS